MSMRTFFVVCFYVLGSFLGGLVGSRVFSSIVHRVKGKHEDNRHECCGICGHPLTRVDMFPVLGLLMRKGRCRYCGAPIPGDSLVSEVIFGMAGIVVVQGITAAAIPTLYRATLFLIGAGSIAGYIAILVSKEKYRAKHK